MRTPAVLIAMLLVTGAVAPAFAADAAIVGADRFLTDRASPETGTASLWLPAASRPAHDPWRVSFAPADVAAPITVKLDVAFDDAATTGAAQPLHPAAVEYSDGYQKRRKIHKYASFAMLPLFVTEFALGQSMYNNTPADNSSSKGVHAAVGAGIVSLFAVNTVTGAWNLFGEGWKDPEGRPLRVIHGILMMAAEAGFVATAASGPNSGHARGAATYETDKQTHRNIAVASMSVATVSYVMMLFGHH